MSAAVELVAWVAGIWLTLAVAIAWAWSRAAKRRPRIHRDAAPDLTTCEHIWPDPPTWRTTEAQHRHDSAQQQKEEQ